jgi:hypothetical protein
MLRVVVCASFFVCVSAVHAEHSECAKLGTLAGGPENGYHPPLEAAVVGKGRLHFFSAPNARCQVKGIIVIPGDVVTVYKSYDGWANVMYIAKDGEDFMGWVKEDRLRRIGQYGANP